MAKTIMGNTADFIVVQQKVSASIRMENLNSSLLKKTDFQKLLN